MKSLVRTSRLVSATAVIAVLGLTACSAQPKPAEEANAEVVVQTSPAVGPVDHVTWAVTSEPASMDWIYNADTATGQIMSNVCEGLFRLDVNMAPEPAIAESVTTPDPLTRVYQLREGVTFHDGSLLTADDVVFSLTRHMDPAAGSYWAGPFAKVESIAATGPLEVTITLTEPDGLLDSYLSSPAGIIENRKSFEEIGDAYGTPRGGVNCIGPFSLEEWEAGQSITLKKDPNYFDERFQSLTERIEFQFVRDPSALTNGLLSGTIDGAWDVPTAAISKLNSSGIGKVYQGPSTRGYNAIVMNTENALADPIVRQALSLAIDREAIIKVAVSGAATEQRAPAVPGTWSYETERFQAAWDSIEVGQSDLEAAKKLLSTTAKPTEPIVIASSSAEPQTPIIAAEIQSAAKNLGLEAEIRSIPADRYYAVYTDPSAREGIDLYLTGWGTDFADPTQIYSYFTTGNLYNFTNFSDPEVDQLIAAASETDDLGERASLVIEAQQKIVDESLWLPIFAPTNPVFLNDRITGSPASYVQLHHPWAAAIGASS